MWTQELTGPTESKHASKAGYRAMVCRDDRQHSKCPGRSPGPEALNKRLARSMETLSCRRSVDARNADHKFLQVLE